MKEIKIEDAVIIQAIKDTNSFLEAALLMNLGYSTFYRRAKKLGLQNPTFHGHGLVTFNNSRRHADEIVFVENSTFPRHRLKYRLIKEEKIEYRCQCCGLGDEWNGKKLSLQLDHINGVNNDNRIGNLRFLCPNCHAQQGTYAGKNKCKKIGG